jgi:hypothetical protein
MEIKEALEKILDFVRTEEARNEAKVYSFASSKDWNEVRVAVEKMGCFSMVRGFIEGMLEDLEKENERS